MLLRTYLKRTGLHQKEFAARVGATQSAVSCWSAGVKVPNSLFVFRIERETSGKVTLADHLAARVKSAPRKQKPSDR